MLDKSSKEGAQTRVPWAVVINPTGEGRRPPASKKGQPQKQRPGRSGKAPRNDIQCDDAIVRALMDVLITPAGMVQPQERAFTADLLLQVLDYATPEAKTALCDRLANMPDAPSSLIARFVHDVDLDIAEPLLLRASCVSDQELLSVIEVGDKERVLMIAKRQHLSTPVGTALAKLSDLDIALALVRNPCARLSDEALRHLAAMAPADAKLAEALVHRSDMSTSCALDLFWTMPAKQRAYTLGRFMAEAQVLQQILVMGKPGVDLIAGALNCGGEVDKKDKADPSLVDQPSKKKSEKLAEAVEAGDAERVSELIASYVGVDDATAHRVVSDPGCEPLTVACKALGVSRFAFAAACAKWVDAHNLEAEQDALEELFDRLSFRQARMALTYWDWQTRRIGPYAD